MNLIPRSITLLEGAPGLEVGAEIPFTYDHHDGTYWARVGTPLINVPYSVEECEAMPEFFKVNYVEEKQSKLDNCLCMMAPQKRATLQQILDKRLAEINASAIAKTERIHTYIQTPTWAPHSSRL